MFSKMEHKKVTTESRQRLQEDLINAARNGDVDQITSCRDNGVFTPESEIISTAPQITTLPLITKGKAPKDVLEKLNRTYPFDSSTKMDSFFGIKRKEPVSSCWTASKVIVNHDYSVSLPEGYMQRTESFRCDARNSTDPIQCDALAAAFSAVVPGIETILNKKLWGEHQVNISVILYYPELSQNWSGSWHRDGSKTLTTSILYFHHHDVTANINFRAPTVNETGHENITSIATCAGDIVTFADRVLEHRVNNVSTTSQSGLRGLVTFFYHDPHGIPASLKEKNISAENVIQEDRVDDKVSTIWRV